MSDTPRLLTTSPPGDAAAAPEPPKPQPEPKATLSITVDGKAHEARPGQLVIDAAEDAGVYVPRFCYHPRMTPVGMCRQCLVEVEGPRGPMMVVSCMTPVADKQVIHTDSPTVKKAQEGVLEFLLANHPLDCPVCDKGGECPLQDQAFSHGPGESRFVEEKRHYEKPIPISDLVFLDKERCILCDRCTRFADEVAGDPLIHFTHRGNTTQVETFPDSPFSSYFSGNTVQICPVGALTAKPYRFKARPWDLDQTRSTCTTCSVGCQTVVQSSRDELLRYQGYDAPTTGALADGSEPGSVNWGWLCDKGRFSFESVNSGDRLGEPAVLEGDQHVLTTWDEALARATRAITKAINDGGPSNVAVLGGARLATEDAVAWGRLAKRVIGTPHVDAQIGDGLATTLLRLPRATVDQACAATTVVLLAPDLKEELPVLYLRIRDAAEKRKIRLIEIAPAATGLTKYTYKSVRHIPGEQADAIRQLLTDEAEQLAKGNVVAIVGRGNLAESAQFTLDAVAMLQGGVPSLTVLPALRRGNVMGALAAGLTPGEGGHDATGILQAAAAGQIGCLILLGADPLADFPDRQLAEAALAGAGAIVAVDTFLNESASRADVVLAASAYAERGGTTTNIEGRHTPLAAKVTAKGTSRPDWVIANDISVRLGNDLGIGSLAELTAQLPNTVDATTVRLTPSSSAAPVLNGYQLRLVVGRKLYDQAVSLRTSASMAKLAPGTSLRLNPTDADRIGAKTGTTVRVSSSRGSVTVPVTVDSGVIKGAAYLPFNQPDITVAVLIDASQLVTDITVESV
jgi:NADH-quinone oxidoreductase subunit G